MDNRYDKIMDRTGQANIRIFHIGFGDERDNEVVDIYPCSNGRLVPLFWKKTDRFITPSRREEILNAIKPFRNLSHEWKATTLVRIPCATEGCMHTTVQTVHNIESEEGREFMSKRAEEFFCESCRESNTEKTTELIEQLNRVCPRIFREGETVTDTRFFPPNAWEALRRWGENIRSSTRSLYIHGGSGVCKSRMVFELLRRYVVPQGLSFKVYSGGEFRREQEKISETRFDKKTDRITSNAEDVGVLVFDDFGQEELTGAMQGNLRWLLDYRLGNCLPTIIISNMSPKRLSQQYGDNIFTDTVVRRILDFCYIVEVKATKQSLDAIRKRKRAEEKKEQGPS